nr:uncharacterized protein LOC111999862 isoform X3 [Quercus suber]
MSFCSSLSSSLSSPKSFSFSFLPKTKPLSFNGVSGSAVTYRFRASADVPDFLSADWVESRKKRPFGPRLNFSAEEAVQHQLDALKYNDQPRQDYGIEVMYRFAGFDPFERSTYFGPFFDLGQCSLNGLGGFFTIQHIEFYLVIRIERFLAACL